MIRSFRCSDTQLLFDGRFSRRLPQQVQRQAARKLEILNAATALDDLRVPPGNHLEKLAGDRVDQYSIRINRQYRICFRWQAGDAYDVEIVDYH